MASNVEVLSRHAWLIQTILQAGPSGMLLEEVQSKWHNKWGGFYSRKTFHNHRTAISEIFGIEIKCNRHTNSYYIPFSSSLLDSSSIRSWLINTFTITNALAVGGDNLVGRMQMEDIPSGQLWLGVVIEAMESNNVLKISYRKYTSEESETLDIHPYALKEMERRWYLVAYCEQRDDVRVYGLDRILSIRQKDATFTMPEGFDLGTMFGSSYGVYLPDKGQEAVEITFRATPMEAKYIRDLPIHGSQTEVKQNVFTIKVIPNVNLIMEFCRRGDRIEVLSPSDIREEVEKELTRAADLYKDRKLQDG